MRPFVLGFPTALGSVGDSLLLQSPASCSQHATLLIFLRWWFLLSRFCCLCLTFTIYYCQFQRFQSCFLSFFTILNCGKIQITERYHLIYFKCPIQLMFKDSSGSEKFVFSSCQDNIAELLSFLKLPIYTH